MQPRIPPPDDKIAWAEEQARAERDLEQQAYDEERRRAQQQEQSGAMQPHNGGPSKKVTLNSSKTTESWSEEQLAAERQKKSSPPLGFQPPPKEEQPQDYETRQAALSKRTADHFQQVREASALLKAQMSLFGFREDGSLKRTWGDWWHRRTPKQVILQRLAEHAGVNLKDLQKENRAQFEKLANSIYNAASTIYAQHTALRKISFRKGFLSEKQLSALSNQWTTSAIQRSLPQLQQSLSLIKKDVHSLPQGELATEFEVAHRNLEALQKELERATTHRTAWTVSQDFTIEAFRHIHEAVKHGKAKDRAGTQQFTAAAYTALRDLDLLANNLAAQAEKFKTKKDQAAAINFEYSYVRGQYNALKRTLQIATEDYKLTGLTKSEKILLMEMSKARNLDPDALINILSQGKVLSIDTLDLLDELLNSLKLEVISNDHPLQQRKLLADIYMVQQQIHELEEKLQVVRLPDPDNHLDAIENAFHPYSFAAKVEFLNDLYKPVMAHAVPLLKSQNPYFPQANKIALADYRFLLVTTHNQLLDAMEHLNESTGALDRNSHEYRRTVAALKTLQETLASISSRLPILDQLVPENERMTILSDARKKDLAEVAQTYIQRNKSALQQMETKPLNPRNVEALLNGYKFLVDYLKNVSNPLAEGQVEKIRIALKPYFQQQVEALIKVHDLKGLGILSSQIQIVAGNEKYSGELQGRINSFAFEVSKSLEADAKAKLATSHDLATLYRLKEKLVNFASAGFQDETLEYYHKEVLVKIHEDEEIEKLKQQIKTTEKLLASTQKGVSIAERATILLKESDQILDSFTSTRRQGLVGNAREKIQTRSLEHHQAELLAIQDYFKKNPPKDSKGKNLVKQIDRYIANINLILKTPRVPFIQRAERIGYLVIKELETAESAARGIAGFAVNTRKVCEHIFKAREMLRELDHWMTIGDPDSDKATNTRNAELMRSTLYSHLLSEVQEVANENNLFQLDFGLPPEIADVAQWVQNVFSDTRSWYDSPTIAAISKARSQMQMQEVLRNPQAKSTHRVAEQLAGMFDQMEVNLLANDALETDPLQAQKSIQQIHHMKKQLQTYAPGVYREVLRTREQSPLAQAFAERFPADLLEAQYLVRMSQRTLAMLKERPIEASAILLSNKLSLERLLSPVPEFDASTGQLKLSGVDSNPISRKEASDMVREINQKINTYQEHVGLNPIEDKVLKKAWRDGAIAKQDAHTFKTIIRKKAAVAFTPGFVEKEQEEAKRDLWYLLIAFSHRPEVLEIVNKDAVVRKAFSKIQQDYKPMMEACEEMVRVFPERSLPVDAHSIALYRKALVDIGNRTDTATDEELHTAFRFIDLLRNQPTTKPGDLFNRVKTTKKLGRMVPESEVQSALDYLKFTRSYLGFEPFRKQILELSMQHPKTQQASLPNLIEKIKAHPDKRALENDPESCVLLDKMMDSHVQYSSLYQPKDHLNNLAIKGYVPLDREAFPAKDMAAAYYKLLEPAIDISATPSPDLIKSTETLIRDVKALRPDVFAKISQMFIQDASAKVALAAQDVRERCLKDEDLTEIDSMIRLQSYVKHPAVQQLAPSFANELQRIVKELELLFTAPPEGSIGELLKNKVMKNAIKQMEALKEANAKWLESNPVLAPSKLIDTLAGFAMEMNLRLHKHSDKESPSIAERGLQLLQKVEEFLKVTPQEMAHLKLLEERQSKEFDERRAETQGIIAKQLYIALRTNSLAEYKKTLALVTNISQSNPQIWRGIYSDRIVRELLRDVNVRYKTLEISTNTNEKVINLITKKITAVVNSKSTNASQFVRAVDDLIQTLEKLKDAAEKGKVDKSTMEAVYGLVESKTELWAEKMPKSASSSGQGMEMPAGVQRELYEFTNKGLRLLFDSKLSKQQKSELLQDIAIFAKAHEKIYHQLPLRMLALFEKIA